MPDLDPAVITATGAHVALTGSTAANIDIADKLSSALPIFMIVVIGLTFLVLLVAFRSRRPRPSHDGTDPQAPTPRSTRTDD